MVTNDTDSPTCPFCQMGDQPWVKNQVWIHTGGAACEARLTLRPTLLDQARERELSPEVVAEHREQVLARLANEQIRNWSDAELLRCLQGCALPVFCLAVAMQLRDAGEELPTLP